MKKVDVQKLADLARIEVSSDELEELELELPVILDFVELVQESGATLEKKLGTHYNIYREDSEPHETGKYSERLIEAMPQNKNGYLKVRKIIQN